MIFASIDVESLVVGKDMLVVLVGLCTVFVFCFAMGLNSLRSARKIVKEHGDIEKLKTANAELETQRDALTAELATKRDERENYATATKFLELQPHLVAEHEKLEKAIANKELALQKLNEQLAEATKKENELKAVVSELGELEREKAVLDGERKAAEDARDNAKKQTSEEVKKKEQLDAESRDLLKKKDSLEHEIQNQKETNAKLEKETKDLGQKKQDLEKWLAENGKKIQELGDIDDKIALKKKMLEDIEKQIGEANKTIDGTMKNIEAALDRLNKMNLSGVQTLRQNAFVSIAESVFDDTTPATVPAFGSHDEQKALSEVAGHFERSGFVVPPRLLKAFHTSLKTSDMSSLTVMAGVSGTGKSAIPKLYAEAMGIKFQPLAVEPRWDSPKDLLGFFNYVTNRYEPTALARALFQFQGLHGKSFKPKVDMSEYMLMPMLDEMNLARIEYYFSEFLSKLEMRRLVAPLTRENLGVVALEIFQGWKGKGEDGTLTEEDPIRLFANQNTLFVGTMNEDETTQSLSDKVIDRANVLYFGRPNTLQGRAGGGDAMLRAPLLKTTWDSWHKNPEEGVLKFASDVLGSLNKTLADFNRPFAHRTYQAMLSYIANYPVEDGEDKEEAIRRALADQVGMRVMPKLYGVDLALHQETFEQVYRVLGNIGDRMLLNAFEAASSREQNRSGFFHWTGFDWNG